MISPKKKMKYVAQIGLARPKLGLSSAYWFKLKPFTNSGLNQCFPIPYGLNEGLGSTLGENLSIKTIRCDLPIATHGRKLHKKSFWLLSKVLWDVVLGQLTTITLWLTTGMIYSCTFLLS
jgi:hypothetical protein